MQRQKQIAGRTPHYAGSVPSPARAAAPTKPAPSQPTALAMDLVLVGVTAAMHAFNTRSWRQIHVFVADAASSDELKRRAGYSALYGVALSLTGLLDSANASGQVRLTGSVPARCDVDYAVRSDIGRFNGLLKSLIETAKRVKDAVPDMTAAMPTAKQKTEDVTAIEPIAVRVVSLPARETATKVKRNQNGEIESTLQYEVDA
jgi:hypothetical protein